MRVVTFLSAVTLAACASAPEIKVEKSEAEVHRIDTSKQSFLDFTPAVALELFNEAPVNVKEVYWEVVRADKVLKSGTTPVNKTIAKGEMIELTADAVPYTNDPEGLAEILENEGALDILFRGQVRDATGTRLWDFTRFSRVRSPRVPKVKVWHIEGVGYPSEERIRLVFLLRVQNDNSFDLNINQLTYNLAVNGAPIEEGVTGKNEKVIASTAAQLEVEVNVLKETIMGKVPLSYALEGELTMPVGRVPVELEGPIELGAAPPEE
jgi:hypothetical protein